MFVVVITELYTFVKNTNCTPKKVNSTVRKLYFNSKKRSGSFWGGRWEGGSGLGTRVHPWRIHVDVWQNQYNIVKEYII